MPETLIRELVLEGERREGRQIVARSHAEFTLREDESLERCLSALRDSDVALANNPDTLYTWDLTWVERHDAGGKVVFGVNWYDEAFFDEKKDVYLGRMHQGIYRHIGIDVEAATITHWRAA